MMEKQPTFDFEEEAEKARWYKGELDSGTGWTKRCEIPGKFTAWSKTFPDKEFPIVSLYEFLNMPMPYEKCAEMLNSSDLELREKWDKAFGDWHSISNYPDGAFTYHVAVKRPWPMADRNWILHRGPVKEIDWFGKRALLMAMQDVSSTSYFVSPGTYVRASNGGNFQVAMPDDEDPKNKSRCFGMSNNLPNGWMPNNEWLLAKGVVKCFSETRENVIDGYNEYYK